MIRIILMGYMGSGKTTVGRALAKDLKLSFYDLDLYIEERQHRTVPQLFEEHGEEGFRIIEKKMLRELGEFENVVISSGGGTPCFFDNLSYMNKQAQTVYLEAAPKVLFDHLKTGKTERPLLKGKTENEMMEYIKRTLHTREPFYKQAQHILNVNQLESYDKIKDTVRLIRELINI